MKIRNPIIPGFNPDPSIVRVGDDFYIATSSFSYYPGLPVYHSRDLVNWEFSSYVFSTPTALPLTPDHISGGLFAPTLRFHEGLFYVIVTNVTSGFTGIVTAENPEGTWSEPHFIEHLFDPDIFWDADGKCYVAYASFRGEKRICVRELDTEKWELVGEEHGLWDCALYGAASPEAPHIYHIGNWYYLMIAEGGTEHFHAVTIARSRELFGPYEGNPANPILTHRHLANSNPICNVGHADLVQIQDGSWYAVFLGSRIYGGYHKNLGRETFIAPVIWEDEWPKIAPETGKCEFEYDAPELPAFEARKVAATDDFDGEKLTHPWNFLGTPVNDVYRLEGGKLYLKAVADPIRPTEIKKRKRMAFGQPAPVESRALAYVARRQEHMSFTASCPVEFEPKDTETAGMAIVQNNFNGLRIEIGLEDGKKVARAMKYFATPQGIGFDVEIATGEEVLGKAEVEKGSVKLEISAQGQDFSFFVNGKCIASGVNGGFMGSETAGGFVGAYVGMFCSGNGKESGVEAAFDSFTY